MGEAVVRGMATLVAVLVSLPPGTAAHAAGGDAARGERVFQRCYACHSVDPNETAKLQGPSLFRIVGRPAAAIAGFEYSDVMREKGASGLVWNATNLDRYLADPEGFVPGTRMSALPLRDAQERADLIAYLARSGPSNTDEQMFRKPREDPGNPSAAGLRLDLAPAPSASSLRPPPPP